jgi:hypothetical protein
MGQLSFWDESRRLDKLSELGDCLVRLQKAINWNLFLPTRKPILTFRCPQRI